MTLEPEYTMDQVAEMLGMSPRWVRSQLPTVEHQRYGHKVRFTESQVEKFRAARVKQPDSIKKSVTTGRRKSA